MSIEDMCQQTMTFKSCTVTSGSMGGESRTYASISGLASVPVSIQRGAGRLTDTFERRGIKQIHSIYSDTDLSAVSLGDIGVDGNGDKYIVQQNADMGAQGRAWSVYADLIPPSQ